VQILKYISSPTKELCTVPFIDCVNLVNALTSGQHYKCFTIVNMILTKGGLSYPQLALAVIVVL
jgi:hypothetical protein